MAAYFSTPKDIHMIYKIMIKMPVQVGLPEDQRGCRERDGCSWCSLWSGRTTRSSTPVQKTPTTKHRPPLGWQQLKSSSRCLLVGIRPGRFVCRTSIPLVELSWILWGRNFHVKKSWQRGEKKLMTSSKIQVWVTWRDEREAGPSDSATESPANNQNEKKTKT